MTKKKISKGKRCVKEEVMEEEAGIGRGDEKAESPSTISERAIKLIKMEKDVKMNIPASEKTTTPRRSSPRVKAGEVKTKGKRAKK